MNKDTKLKNKIDLIYGYITNASRKAMADNEAGSPWGIEGISDISTEYECLMNEETKKETGRFYTHRSIIKHILSKVLEGIHISADPFIRILDPSCGCGYFLLEAYDMLKEMYIADLTAINSRNPGLNLGTDCIHDHIIKYNLFGADIDEYGVKLTRAGLMLKNIKSDITPNIICCDSLMDFENTFLKEKDFFSSGFDVIIGNPPYIGHKKTNGKYRKKLYNIYGDVFKDKADISFCFIKSSIDRLKDGGKLGFVTSRYFLESPSGEEIRRYIKNNCSIDEIIDFYGIRIMQGISIDPVIIFLRKADGCGNTINIIKAEKNVKKFEVDDVFQSLNAQNSPYFASFCYSQDMLEDKGWALWHMDELSVLHCIEDGLTVRLDDVCKSFQGIITGCDAAFIVDKKTLEEKNIENGLIKPWIKNRFVHKYKVIKPEQYIIYSDLIDNPENFKNAISYIEKYRERLENRRECKRGVRKWYQLQWGRDIHLFETEKIVFPFKASSNRFALDKGSLSSADVYGMKIKAEYKNKISYEFLLGLLNSKLYEFYFKSFAKKLGDNLYDYYPNTVMRLMIPTCSDENISLLVRELMAAGDKNTEERLMDEIDRYVYKLFNMTDEQIKIIERRLFKY